MANFNKVLLMGNLTRDPELRFGGGGNGAICKFGLAVNRTWRNQNGEKQDETCFVDVVVFGRQAETCNEYLAKGRPVFIEGRLSFSTWEDRESGARRSKLEVVGERVQFLGGRNDGGGSGGRGGGHMVDDDADTGDNTAQRGGFEQRAPQRPAPQRAPAPQPTPAQGIDFDDIPF